MKAKNNTKSSGGEMWGQIVHKQVLNIRMTFRLTEEWSNLQNSEEKLFLNYNSILNQTIHQVWEE